MPTTTVPQDGFTLSLFRQAVIEHGVTTLSFTHHLVGKLDNQGEVCAHCSDIAQVTLQVYFRSLSTGEDVMMDGCATCLVAAVAADAASDLPVQLETVA